MYEAFRLLLQAANVTRDERRDLLQRMLSCGPSGARLGRTGDADVTKHRLFVEQCKAQEATEQIRLREETRCTMELKRLETNLITRRVEADTAKRRIDADRELGRVAPHPATWRASRTHAPEAAQRAGAGTIPPRDGASGGDGASASAATAGRRR